MCNKALQLQPPARLLGFRLLRSTHRVAAVDSKPMQLVDQNGLALETSTSHMPRRGSAELAVDGSRGDHMPGRAVTSLSDREIAELRAVPDVKSAGEAKAGSPAGRGNSTTLPDSGGPPSLTAGRRRKAPAQSPPEGSLSMFSGAVSRPKRPSGELPAQQQPGVEPDLPASQVFGFGYNGHGQLPCRQHGLCGRSVLTKWPTGRGWPELGAA